MKEENEIAQGKLVSIEQKIFLIRGLKVMLDSDLAELYEVDTSQLNRAVKRNTTRFPQDFCFRLSDKDSESLICQFGISNFGRGGRRQLPYVFTEHGVAMLSAVLRSERAVAMSVFVIRAFVKLREMLATNKELAYKIDELEHTQEKQGEAIDEINQAVVQLIGAREEQKEPVGFKPKE